MKKIGFIFLFLIIVNFNSFSQKDWVSDYSSFRILIQKEFMSHPIKSESDGIYISYFIELKVKNGIIFGISYSDTTPEFVILRSKSSLANLNEKFKEKNVILQQDCSLIIPVLLVWKDNKEKVRENILEILPYLYPSGTYKENILIDEPLIVDIFKPVT